MLSKQDGPGEIRVVLIATFRLLPEHPVCSTLLFSNVLLRCVCLRCFLPWLCCWLFDTYQSNRCEKTILASTKLWHSRKKQCWANGMVQEQSGWSWLLPPDCSRSIRFVQRCFFQRFYCYVCRTRAFHNGFIAMCLTSKITIVKSNVSTQVATTHVKTAMLTKQDGTGGIRVALIANFR